MTDNGIDAWKPRFEKMLGAIEQWTPFITDTPLEVKAGSALAAEDAVYPDLPASLAAWNGVATAVEHLSLFRDVMMKLPIYPNAYFTILRSALMGSAQTIWQLSPDDEATRLSRALHLTYYGLTQELKRYGAAKPIGGADPRHLDKATQNIKRKQTEIEAAAIGRGITAPTTAWTPNVTDMVNVAGPLVFDEGGDSELLTAATDLAWRDMSAIAHATPGAGLATGSHGVLLLPNGKRWRLQTATLVDIAPPAVAAVKFTSTALNWFSLRANP